MKKNKPTYLLFYFLFTLVIVVAVFFEKELLIYTKPLVSVSLLVLYIKYVKIVDPFFVVSIFLIIATDIFTYIDFLKYYDIIAVLIAMFYTFCVLSLKSYIIKKDIALQKLISPPVIISIVLIGYLIFSITELVLPKIQNSVGMIVIIVVSLVVFSGVSFFIYVADRYEKSIYLFIAACCTLFVDALLAINELYYYNRVFTALINIAEIAGLYFFTSFFIETKEITNKSIEKEYF